MFLVYHVVGCFSLGCLCIMLVVSPQDIIMFSCIKGNMVHHINVKEKYQLVGGGGLANQSKGETLCEGSRLARKKVIYDK